MNRGEVIDLEESQGRILETKPWGPEEEEQRWCSKLEDRNSRVVTRWGCRKLGC